MLLPTGFARKFSATELTYVFLHEVAHVKRRDLPVNWLLALLQVMHWFNPLVWFAFARWRADRELACDAMVLEAAGEGHNQAYGRTILRILEGFVPQAITPGLRVGIVEDKRRLRQRISQIAGFAPHRRWPFQLTAILVCGLALVGLPRRAIVRMHRRRPIPFFPQPPRPEARRAAPSDNFAGDRNLAFRPPEDIDASTLHSE